MKSESKSESPYLYARLVPLMYQESACVAPDDAEPLALCIAEQLDDVERAVNSLRDLVETVECMVSSHGGSIPAEVLVGLQESVRTSRKAYDSLTVDYYVSSAVWKRKIEDLDHSIVLDVPDPACESKHFVITYDGDGSWYNVIHVFDKDTLDPALMMARHNLKTLDDAVAELQAMLHSDA
jgi:hypothetical protein